MTIAIARDPIYRNRRFQSEIIELCVRWYLTYRLSYRDLVEMMAERRIVISHTTILRWVQRYVPEFERRWARYARRVNSSWRMSNPWLSHGRRRSPMRRPGELDELHLLFAAHTRPVAAKRISIFRVGFRPSTCSALGFHIVNRIATRATMSRKKISHAVLLIGGNIAGRRVDRRIVRHIGILISSKTKQAHDIAEVPACLRTNIGSK
jgi:hypothetical protein